MKARENHGCLIYDGLGCGDAYGFVCWPADGGALVGLAAWGAWGLRQPTPCQHSRSYTSQDTKETEKGVGR
jgi:hypothetical protein